MNVIDCKQGTSQWFQLRAGCCTGSHCADIMGFRKDKAETAARANYRAKLVAEILTGVPQMDGYVSPEMQFGTEQEPFARAAYEMQTGAMVDQVGFVSHDPILRMGGSVDGLVGEEGIIEIKCPKTSTHIGWMLDGAVPAEHEPQISFYLAVTGREWADFVSFDPRLPDPLQLFVKRMWRNPERIAEIEAGVQQFNFEVDKTIERLQELYGKIVIPAQMAAKTALPNMLGVTDEELERYI